jgi:hypothetical protein
LPSGVGDNPSFHLAHLTSKSSEIFTGGFEAGALRLEEMMRRVPFDPQKPALSIIDRSRPALGRKADDEATLRRGRHERNLWADGTRWSSESRHLNASRSPIEIQEDGGSHFD